MGKPDVGITADPLQGFDIRVETVSTAGIGSPTAGGQLVGAFTSAMFKIINQTETYLPLNSRVARQLDGEIVIVWALEQGMMDPDFMKNSFGTNFADAVKLGRGYKIPRSSRFNIQFSVELFSDAKSEDAAVFNNGFFNNSNLDNSIGKEEFQFQLKTCRVDTSSFGLAPGRHIVATSWQGTAEGLSISETFKAIGDS